MSFREFGAVSPMNKGNMGKGGRLPIERLVNMRLARGIGEMIIAADNICNAHIMIVHNNSQHIGWRAVRAQQHKIINILIWEHNASLHGVIDNCFAFQGRFETDDRRDIGRRLAWIAVAPATVIAGRAFFRARNFAHLIEFAL